MNINTNISSINAHTTMLNNSAKNIANMNSDNYVKNKTEIVSNKNNIEAITNKETNPYSDIDLLKDTTDQIISYQAISANTVAIKTQNSVADTLLDIYA